MPGMDDNLTEKIRALLADPQAVERIAAIAGSLGDTTGGGSSQQGTASPQQSDGGQTAQPVSAPQPGGGGFAPRSDPRLDLLRALRPLVAEEKRGRLDDLVRIATVASLLGTMRK